MLPHPPCAIYCQNTRANVSAYPVRDFTQNLKLGEFDFGLYRICWVAKFVSEL